MKLLGTLVVFCVLLQISYQKECRSNSDCPKNHFCDYSTKQCVLSYAAPVSTPWNHHNGNNHGGNNGFGNGFGGHQNNGYGHGSGNRYGNTYGNGYQGQGGLWGR